MKFLIAFLVVFLLYACNSGMRAKKHIESLQQSGNTDKYVMGIACMHYVLQFDGDLEYSKSLVKKLMALGFFTESIHAVEILLRKSPRDPELYYLLGIGYRNMLQYNLAEDNFKTALKLRPADRIFRKEALSVSEEKKIWNEILIMNTTLSNTTDSFTVLLNRAEKFFSIRRYDAVLYDLGSLSKMGSADDSLYFRRSVSSLYQEGGRKSVEILTNMMKHYQIVKTEKSNSFK